MGIERYDRLARKIIGIKERIEDHRHIAPPVGETHKNCVILSQILNVALDGWPGVILLLLRRQINQRIMIRRIRRFRLNAEDVCPGILLNDIGHILGIAQHLAVNDHNTVIFLLGHVIGITGFRHGEVDNQCLPLCGTGIFFCIYVYIFLRDFRFRLCGRFRFHTFHHPVYRFRFPVILSAAAGGKAK